MSMMSRQFTLAEKVLLVILAVILVGLVYYRFVDQPVRESIASHEADAQMYQTQLDAIQQRLIALRGVRTKLDELKEAEGDLTYIPSYNNSQEEITFLNDILAKTLQYSIAFNEVERSGNLIRRKFTLQYQTRDYAQAEKITKKLLNGENRCLVGDIVCKIDAKGIVTVNETATFYETMVGGTPDAALPGDSAAVKQ